MHERKFSGKEGIAKRKLQIRNIVAVAFLSLYLALTLIVDHKSSNRISKSATMIENFANVWSQPGIE